MTVRYMHWILRLELSLELDKNVILKMGIQHWNHYNKIFYTILRIIYFRLQNFSVILTQKSRSFSFLILDKKTQETIFAGSFCFFKNNALKYIVFSQKYFEKNLFSLFVKIRGRGQSESYGKNMHLKGSEDY